MCGIFGIVSRPGVANERSLERAVSSLRHRGPDAQRLAKVFSSERWEIWFGHTRLAILDLSEGGAQPMTKMSSEGRVGSVVFNGEVYNHRALRTSLSERWSFESTSDTEVLLAGLLLEGDRFFAEMNAMMAVGFVDYDQQKLVLARDRLGKKPLYLYRGSDFYVFASELKAFAAMGLPLTESAKARAYYNWLRHVPGTMTIYREVVRVSAGSFVEIDLSADSLSTVETQFWDPLKNCGETFSGTYDEAIEDFLYLLDDATKLRLDADVPVGLFLSGGIDSTLVASSIALQHNAPITAFIFKNEGSVLDESAAALSTARALGLQTSIISLCEADFARQAEKVAYVYDDPCSPVSQLATMALSEVASRDVKVILTGDGGDEIFLGYPGLGRPRELWKYRSVLDKVPGLRSLSSALWRSVFTEFLDQVLTRLSGRSISRRRGLGQLVLDAGSPDEIYEHWLTLWPRYFLSDEDKSQLGADTWLSLVKAFYPNYSWKSLQKRELEERLAAREMVSAMRDEILVKVDRATMAYSLEARSPLMDYRLVEFGLSLPAEFKRLGNKPKRIMRDACSRRVGENVALRPKSGFSTVLPAHVDHSERDPLLDWSRWYDREWSRIWKAQ